MDDIATGHKAYQTASAQSYRQPPLSDYAIIGDCRSCALVSRSGSIDWLCLPDFGSPSVFANLLDADKGGCFSICVENLEKTRRRYVPDSAVLETELQSAQGTIRVTDCMPVLPDSAHSKQLSPLREVLRRVEVIEGNPVISVLVDARPNYAKKQGFFKSMGACGWRLVSGTCFLNLLTDFALIEKKGRLEGQAAAPEGSIFWFSLVFESASPGILMPLGAEAQHRLESTRRWWSDWCAPIHYHGRFRETVIRSAITLRQLTFALSGGPVAAATTSLPEKPGGWMNWDYRYCWPRDAALSLSAFIDIGLRSESDAFLGWLILAANVTRPKLKVMYDVYGNYKIDEITLSHLSGYQGAAPVRIGNKLAHQLQHDVYGEVMLAVNDWVRHFGKPKESEIELLQEFGRAVCAIWREPDNGIWEIRDQRRHYTYSKVMAWYTLHSLLKLHDKYDFDIPVAAFTRERDALRAAIDTHGYNAEKGYYTGVFDSDILDASLLLLPRCGYIDYRDPRMVGTWNAIRDNLQINGLVRRYPEGFGHSQPGEAAFIICNFWAIDYLVGIGDCEEAEKRLDLLLGYANDVGLYAEGILPETGESCGNLPQALSHAGLINTIVQLETAKAEKTGKTQ